MNKNTFLEIAKDALKKALIRLDELADCIKAEEFDKEAQLAIIRKMSHEVETIKEVLVLLRAKSL